MAWLHLLGQASSSPNPQEITLLARVSAATLALLIAYLFVILELITSEYPETFSFILKKPFLHIYGSIYGVLSFFIVLGLDELIKSGNLQIEGLGLSNIWWKACLIGISAKGFLKIRLFSVKTGSDSFPVGIDSIVQIFEPWLLRRIDIEEFNEVRDFLENRVREVVGNNPGSNDILRNLDLNRVKDSMRQIMPSRLMDQEKTKTFNIDLDKAEDVANAMELYLRNFGIKAFERVLRSLRLNDSRENH